MRLGIALDIPTTDPAALAAAYAAGGYSAAVCPPVSLDQPERIRAIQAAFARHNVLLAEIGAWNNLLERDPARRAANLSANIQALALAEAVGVRCCVNIAGSFNPDRWDGPHPQNLSAEAFELTVENVRRIIDAVKPSRTRYCLETMPWVIPDSPEVYRQLLAAVDRPMFGVHLDPVNMINCPARYYDNAAFLRACFEQLGPWIVSCHGKDIRLRDQLTLHLDEVRPGLGALDYGAYLQALNRLPADVPLILEHLPQADYPPARDYVLSVAQANGLHFHSSYPMNPMNPLILTASPNQAGLTAACAAAAQAGFHQLGLPAEIVSLNDLQIGRCQTCNDGWGSCLNDHRCQISDDFQALHARCLQADVLVLITPVYWGDLSEPAKALTDRLRRCEATRGAESGLRNKPVLAVAAAGGSGNGLLTCLASLERWIEHVRARKFDFIAVNRWNRDYKLKTIQAAAQALLTAEF